MAATTNPTTTVRVDARTHQRLTSLAAESGKSMQTIMAEAVEAYYRRDFIARANAQMAAMQRDDPAAWAAIQAEDDLWEATLGDGLEDTP